jgi:hypothetical protein
LVWMLVAGTIAGQCQGVLPRTPGEMKLPSEVRRSLDAKSEPGKEYVHAL